MVEQKHTTEAKVILIMKQMYKNAWMTWHFDHNTPASDVCTQALNECWDPRLVEIWKIAARLSSADGDGRVATLRSAVANFLNEGITTRSIINSELLELMGELYIRCGLNNFLYPCTDVHEGLESAIEDLHFTAHGSENFEQLIKELWEDGVTVVETFDEQGLDAALTELMKFRNSVTDAYDFWCEEYC